MQNVNSGSGEKDSVSNELHFVVILEQDTATSETKQSIMKTRQSRCFLPKNWE